MAKAPKQIELDEKKMYRITLNRVATLHGGTTILRPSMKQIVVTGSLAKELGDAVESAEAV